MTAVLQGLRRMTGWASWPRERSRQFCVKNKIACCFYLPVNLEVSYLRKRNLCIKIVLFHLLYDTDRDKTGRNYG